MPYNQIMIKEIRWLNITKRDTYEGEEIAKLKSPPEVLELAGAEANLPRTLNVCQLYHIILYTV